MKTIAICILLSALCPVTVLAQSLEGVWIVDHVIVGGGEDEGDYTTELQPGLFFFTKSHYSRMYVNGTEPRAVSGDVATDEERLAAADSFTANAGTYEVQGSTITFTRSVAKNPRAMGNSQLAELEWDGDTFWLTRNSNAGDWTIREHYVRVDD